MKIDKLKITLNKRNIIFATISLVIGLLLGWMIFGGSSKESPNKDGALTKAASTGTIWTCSMHPQIRRSEPGNCPICGMKLVPVKSDATSASDVDPMAISMSPLAMQLAGVETAVVDQGQSLRVIRLNGKVEADERLVFFQSSHIPGRIEKLWVNFTGEMVTKGQTIASVYSPQLVTAQEELFEAMKVKESQPELFEAAKLKLKNWKLTEKQINEIISNRKILDTFPIVSDLTGYVLSKKVSLGEYVSTGMPVYEIADLSRVWVLFDVYESDMSIVHKGDPISFTVASLPGEKFKSTVTYIDPVINTMTRVAKARVEMINTGYKLKPEMFTSGTIEASIRTGDNEVIVPKTAVMWTGTRSVVYVKSSTAQAVSFVMREVTLGPAVGGGYIVKEGLQRGEEIAVNGTFSIDAAAQLVGKPSMMNPQGGPAMTGHAHGGMPMASQPSTSSSGTSNTQAQPVNKVAISNEAKEAMRPFFRAYLQMKDALTEDNLEKAKKLSSVMKAELAKANMASFTGESHDTWMKYSTNLDKTLQHMPHQQNLKEFRLAFQQVSEIVIAMSKAFKPFAEPTYETFCPMFNEQKGAYWLSASKEIKNPYFGKEMPGCGEVKSTIR